MKTNLKLTYPLVMLLFVVAFSSCQKDNSTLNENPVIERGNQISINISMEQSIETKADNVNINLNNNTLTWKDGDVVLAVGYANDGRYIGKSTFTISSGSGEKIASFNGETVPNAAKYKFFYPGNKVTVDANGNITKNHSGQVQNGNNNNAHITSNVFFATNDFISDLNSTFGLTQNSSVMKFEISNVPTQVGNLNKIIWTIDTDKGVKMYSLVVNNFSFAQNNSLTAYLAFNPEEANIVANGRCAITLLGKKIFQCVTNVSNQATYQANQTYTTQFGANGSSYVEKFNEIFLKSGYKVRHPELEPSGKQHTITIPAEGNFTFTHDLPLGVTVTPDIKAESEWPEGKYQLFSFKDIDGTQLRLINCRWVRDNYFVMFFISDSHYNSYCTNEECKSYVNKSMALQYDATKFFEPYPGFKINYRPSIVVHGGDLAANRTGDIDNFQNIFAEYYNNNIPFVILYGNHDWDPVHWGSSITGDDWGNNITGANSNEKTLNNVRAALNRSANLGITDIKYYKGNTNGYYDVLPFTFKFRTVRFYCGQTYWYKQWYSPNRNIRNFFGLSNKLAANYYNTDRLINTLENDVKTWKNDPAVWVQHYPLNSNEWWWQREGYNNGLLRSERFKTLAQMQSNFKSIVRQTKNPVMLSGHNHSNSDAKYTDGTPEFTDHTISAFYQKWLIVALVRENHGIVEVRKVQLQ